MKVKVRRVAPFSLARVLAVCLGGLMLIMWLIALPVAAVSGENEMLLFFAVAPVLYAAIAWLSGLLTAWVYNLAAARRIDLELELDVESAEGSSS